MEVEAYEHGVPCWIDLGTSDQAAATKFYSALFGWDVQAPDPELGGYQVALMRGKPVAGLMSQQAPGPPAWSSYVNVDDADKTAEAVATNGGKMVVAPMD